MLLNHLQLYNLIAPRYSVWPNITGWIGSIRPIDSILNRSGALSFASQLSNVIGVMKSTEEQIPTGIDFNAKNSNIIYSRGTTVQPDSLRALMLIRAY